MNPAPSEASVQLCLWDHIQRSGPKSEQPWGCPGTIWAVIQKRKQRGKLTWSLADILELVEMHAQQPYWAPPKPPRKRPEPAPRPRLVVELVEFVEVPRDDCTPTTARMIREGRFPGLYWCSERGGVRTMQTRRII